MGVKRTIAARTKIGGITIAWDIEDIAQALIATDEGIIRIDLAQLVYNEVKKEA